jgi:Na+/H+ antiporter NhaA
MSREMQILRMPVIPDNALTHAVAKWMAYVVVPLFFMFAGLHKAWTTAVTPFEEFLGTSVAIGFALLWPIFVSVMPRRRGAA